MESISTGLGHHKAPSRIGLKAQFRQVQIPIPFEWGDEICIATKEDFEADFRRRHISAKVEFDSETGFAFNFISPTQQQSFIDHMLYKGHPLSHRFHSPSAYKKTWAMSRQGKTPHTMTSDDAKTGNAINSEARAYAA